MNRKRFGIKLVRRIAAPLITVALLLLLVGNLQAITDYVRLYDYQAPSDVATLASQTTMTDYARKLFYVNHPQIADRSTFNAACSNDGEQTIVLGCYHPVDRGIYVYQITDSRLDGVEQVTAAHEMLHAAYDRLSRTEKHQIDTELQDFYDNSEHDQRIRDTIAAYRKSEPDAVVNEMHSIFGTEVGNLPPTLETYYSRYFTNRARVVSYAASYEQEFTSREDQATADQDKLKTMKTAIDTDRTTLANEQSNIDALQRQMSDEKDRGDISAYNADVPVYNDEIDRYNTLVRQLQTEISDYNKLVAEYNALALQVHQLVQALSSQQTPMPQ